jgi:alpha-L-rhamnosidase
MKFSKKFICASHTLNSYQSHTPAPLFRKTFTVDTKPEFAELTITGLGFYRLWLNGTDITKGLLAPYISNPDHIVYYDEYKVPEYLHEGENVIGLMLGNGMQDCPGGEIWDFEKASYRSSPKFALYFETSGLSFEAADGFVTAPGPVFFNDMRCG